MNSSVYKIGFWSSLTAFLSMLSFDIVQALQLRHLVTFPYDEVLIYGFSLGIVIPFLLAMLALHYSVPAERKIWTHATILFTVLYAVFAISNYVVQLAIVIPSTIRGAGQEVQLLVQSPHSLFWNADAIAYICMGFAVFSATPALEQQGIQRWTRYSFLAHAFMTPVIAFVYFYPNFSERLLLLGLPWAITAPFSMLMLTIMFRKIWKDNARNVNQAGSVASKNFLYISKKTELI